jgi:two-component system, cell cycle sensor histidine kinase and response regulator CckA
VSLDVPQRETFKVLLVEDDEDDFILTRSLFSEIKGPQFQLEWVKTFDSGLAAMLRNQHDVCFVDYRLGARNGIELLREAIEKGCAAPVILLTGQGEHEIDLEAMKAGAADYMVKGRLDSDLLERSIRYALERRRAAAIAAAEQARLAAFGAKVGLALTRPDSLDTILRRCAGAMVQFLNAGLARLWISDPETNSLQLAASAGSIPDYGVNGAKFPKLALNLAHLGQGKPMLINQLLADPRLIDREWAIREKVVAFAGYPLILEDTLLGTMAVFARQPLPESILQEMGSVANGIAMCIERKRSAEALGASQFRYQSVVENIKEVIFQINGEGLWTFLNPAWTEITGYKVKETLGTKFSDYVHPDDRERNSELFQQLIERRKSYCHDETRYLAKDGTFRWVEVYAQPNLDNDELGTSGTIRDITDRKRAEAEIEKLAAFVRFNPDPVMELAADGTLTYLNPAARDLARSLGLEDPEAILPKDASVIARECLRMGHSKLSQERSINGRTLSWSFFPIIASQVVHCYGNDATERMNLEAQLRHAQKLESIGQLAAGVAHDFNNILTIIQGHTDRLIEQCEKNPASSHVTEPLRQVSAAARRASSLTRQLLMFSRRQVMQPKVLDLNAVIANMAQMLQRLLGDDISCDLRYDSTIPSIEADTGMVEQVVMNLAVNSRDAMPKGGQLLITTSAVQIDDAYVQQHSESRTGRFVCISVTDTGIGMSKETLARIFEPFFTTKEVGKGTGLGLATVYGIVKQHQGWVEVMSELNIGTTFKVYLPTTSKAVEVSDKPQRPSVRGGNETILLVEDEPVLRELARVILSDYDYRVLEACSGVEALKVWDEHGGNIDLLLTDMVMPEGVSGRELAETLRAKKPSLKIIFTSGYSSDVMGPDVSLGDIKFLQKPYPPRQLAQTVRDSLDTPAPACGARSSSSLLKG